MYNDFPDENVSHPQGGTQSPIVRRITPLPVRCFRDERFTVADYRALGIVSASAADDGWCPLTQVQISTLIHRNRATVSRALARLTQWGYLLVAHGLYDTRLHRKRQTAYRLADPPEPSDSE